MTSRLGQRRRRDRREEDADATLGRLGPEFNEEQLAREGGGALMLSEVRLLMQRAADGLQSQGLTALHWCDVPLCVHASLEPSTHLLLGSRSENMADRAMKGRMPSATAARWRRLSRAERSARSRQLRDALKTRGWDEDVVRELVHGIDPDHPTLF